MESESVEILSEALAGARKSVMTYFIGKDSLVMPHLPRKAFHPPPFSLLHVDSTWNFRDMYVHRELAVLESGMQLLVYASQDSVGADINPFSHGSSHCTGLMKTQALHKHEGYL